VSSDRAVFARSLRAAEVDALAADPQLCVLQTSSPVDTATWDLLNDRFFTKRPEVELRVFGFYGSACDFKFLSRLQNVRRFSADCLMKAYGIEQVAALEQLESLTVGIFDLESFEFLEQLRTSNLRELSLCATKSKKPSLAPLARFSQLRKLYLEGQQKNIDVVSGLATLEDLTLRSINVPDLDFLRDLRQLWSLGIKLGGSKNLSALDGMAAIKYLELWQVRGLDDISVISTLTGLQYLFLQSLPHIARIPDLSRLGALRRIYLENLKGLREIRALATAPALEELMHCSAEGMQPDQYLDLLKSPTLRRLWVGFGSEKKNETLRSLAQGAGIEAFQRCEFAFR
jgi:hypothetical protein